MELDHFFLMTDPGAPVAEVLVGIGLLEGSRNVHPGQGTANRRFFFRNAMLELLWVTDEAEAASPPIRDTHLAERWAGRATGSPLGVSLRAAPDAELPFPTWDYRPPYLPAPLAIPVATNAHRTDEPFLFSIPFGRRPDAADAARREPLEHPAGVREVTAVTVGVPEAGGVSRELRALVATGLVRLAGGGHRLEVELDGGERGVVHDLRPTLPLVVRW